MRVAVRKVSQNSSRILQLLDMERLKDVCLETPLLLNLTKGASIPHISKEVYDDSMIADHNQAFLVTLTNTIHMKAACEKMETNILNFAGFPNVPQVLTLKDPSEQVKEKPQEKESVALYTRSGKQVLTSEDYMKVVEVFKPEIYEALSDSDNNADSSKKRITKASESSQKLLLDCIELHKNSPTLSKSLLIASVQGGYNEIERQKYLKFLVENNDDSIGGYSIEGLHLRGTSATSLTFKQIKSIIELCTEALPANKPRIMYGAYNPVTLLQLVASGIDIFDSSYVYLATQAAKVLTFSFSDDKTKYPFALDMKDERFKEDLEPFMKNCECLACQKMTRAYVYHLVNCRELLANTLILIHNLYHYKEFFKVIRKSIEEGTLDNLINVVSQQYEELDLTVNERKEKAFSL